MLKRFSYEPFLSAEDALAGGDIEDTYDKQTTPQETDKPEDKSIDKDKPKKKEKISFTPEQQEHIDRVISSRISKERQKWIEEQKMSADELEKKRLEEEKQRLEEEKIALQREKRELAAKKALAGKGISEKWLKKIDLSNDNIFEQVDEIAALIAEERADEKNKWTRGIAPYAGSSGGGQLSDAATAAKNIFGETNTQKVTAFTEIK